MADLDFPASPTNGQEYSSEGQTWTYNTAKGVWRNTTASNEWPIGYIYQTTVSTNPGTLFEYGTWVTLNSGGRVPIGVGTGDASDATAWTLRELGGQETHTLTTGEMPNHRHSMNNTTRDSGSNSNNRCNGSGTDRNTANNGSGNSHNNMQPVIGVYMFERTA